MTNAELIAKIKVEIDKRYAEYREKMKSDDFTYYEGMADALDLFEQFIDTLESEKPMEQEKEVKSCHRTRKRLTEWSKTPEGRESYEKVAKEMRKQIVPKDLEEAAKDYTDSSEWLIGENLEHIEASFIAVAKWQKEQMLKDAVEAFVLPLDKEIWCNELDKFPELKEGEKVKLIIIKEN